LNDRTDGLICLEVWGGNRSVTEAEEALGEMLGRDRLMEWARTAPIDGPAALAQCLLSRLGEFRKGSLVDDETIIFIQRGNCS
jgi:serine phosphatase RsbU (regulator of sigma subunit)